MADSLAPTSADIARKRSRSSSPSTDSASKKANQATQAPVKLELDDDEEDNSNENGGNGAEMQTDDKDADKTTDEAAPMNVDSTNPPSSSVSASVAAANPDLPANPEAANADAAAATTAAASIQMRALIVTQDASIIIGKQGKNVNEIRDKSGAKITITEAVPGNPERIMVIAGQLDAVSKVSFQSHLSLFEASHSSETLAMHRLSVSSFDESTMNRSTFPQFPVPEPSLSDSSFPTLVWVQSSANPVRKSKRFKKLPELDSKRPKRCSLVQLNEFSQSLEWQTRFISPFITLELYFRNIQSLVTTLVTDLVQEITDLLLRRVRGVIGMEVLDLLLRVEEEVQGMLRGKEVRDGKVEEEVEEVEWVLLLDQVLKLNKSSFLMN